MIIDFHSHILPGIDDGSKNIEMTREMLAESISQKIDVQVATPHFYAYKMTLDDFLKERDEALKKTMALPEVKDIQLLVGAEVAFFTGMGRADGLEEVCIEGTNLLLVEMPFAPWNESCIRELERLLDGGFQPVLAHVERFLDYKHDRKAIKLLNSLPIVRQSNAEFFTDEKDRKRALKMLKKGEIHILGTDCHNMTSRRPDLKEGRRIIRDGLGAEYLGNIDGLSRQLLFG